MSDYNNFCFTVNAGDVPRILDDAKKAGVSALLYINGLFYDIKMQQEKQQDPKYQDLAKKITDAVFNYDPYNGADEDDVTASNARDLATIDGCREIIGQLCDLLLSL